MLTLTEVLVAYGCLTSDDYTFQDDDSDDVDLEISFFQITPAGSNVGMLYCQNALWLLVAMGGAWDVVGASARLDSFRARMKAFEDDISFLDDDGELFPSSQSTGSSDAPIAQQEGEELRDYLRKLTAAELAGYVACLSSEGYRRTASQQSSVELFQRLSVPQQKAIQSSLHACERLIDVQNRFGVEAPCELDLSTCEVVTAWAEGCSWNDALEMSESAPGDLARMFGRVLDTLRQLNRLPFTPIRASNMDGTRKSISPGIHPEIRRLCRDAAKSINRYPVKDPLPFDTDPEEVLDELEVDDSDEEVDGDAENDETA
jgi:hypothetical protein